MWRMEPAGGGKSARHRRERRCPRCGSLTPTLLARVVAVHRATTRFLRPLPTLGAAPARPSARCPALGLASLTRDVFCRPRSVARIAQRIAWSRTPEPVPAPAGTLSNRTMHRLEAPRTVAAASATSSTGPAPVATSTRRFRHDRTSATLASRTSSPPLSPRSGEHHQVLDPLRRRRRRRLHHRHPARADHRPDRRTQGPGGVRRDRRQAARGGQRVRSPLGRHCLDLRLAMPRVPTPPRSARGPRDRAQGRTAATFETRSTQWSPIAAAYAGAWARDTIR